MLKIAFKKKCVMFGLSVALLAPALASANVDPSIIQGYVSRQALVPLIKPTWGNFILHTEPLNKLYSLRAYQALWVDANGSPNALALSLRSVLLSADRHGLNISDYWDAEVETLYKAALSNQKNWITFELAVSEAVLRYVTHMSVGRFDPEQIDEDIKYKQREFTEFAQLNTVLSGAENTLSAGLDRFMPTHRFYKDLMAALVELKSLRNAGGWSALTSPGFALKLGVKDPLVSALRTRLNQLGYKVSTAGGDNFDAEFDRVLRTYQAKNGLAADGVIGTRSEVLRALNITVQQRISQVEVSLEKLRWLPRVLEKRHIFVNLATAEFRLFDEAEQPVFYFKTVTGQPFRRTPSMKDSLTFVNLNPYWTVPRSIAIKDKLPAIMQNPRYLDRNNMVLIDEATDQIVDHRDIDWQTMTPKDFTYYIRQLPGPENALGVVKFPLQNPWAIYMHDTNEKQLFTESKRHRSSGCVRLEQPLELAAYLLRDQSNWSLEDIRNYVPAPGSSFTPGELDKRIVLKRPMPVYFLYLTVEKNEDGSLRFIEDTYGQDTRVSKAVQNKRNSGELF